MRYNPLSKISLFFIFSFCISIIEINAQPDTSYIEIKSKMWFTSELDHSLIVMDDEGNQYDHYNNYILVDSKSGKLKIPYDSNYIFWDEYDENMNVPKKIYIVVLQVITLNDEVLKYKLFKVFDKDTLLYDATRKNPFLIK